MCALNDIAEQITAQQCFAIEFETAGVYRYISVNFWKDSELCRVFNCRSFLPATDATGELGSVALLLTAVSTKPDGVAISRCNVDLAKTIDQSEYFTRRVQSCFRFEQLSLPTLMHKFSYSVFGRIDFFSVLLTLMVYLGRSFTENWVIGSLELAKVSSLFCSTFLGVMG